MATQVTVPSAGTEPGAVSGAPSPSASETAVSQPTAPSTGAPVSPAEEPKPTEPVSGQPGGADGAKPEAELPWHRDPRFQEDLAALKSYKSNKPAIDAILEQVATPEDARYLVDSVRQARERERQRADDPVSFALSWQQENPESWRQVATATFHATLPVYLERKVAELRAAGDEASASVVETLLGEARQGGVGREPSSPGPSQLQAERASLDRERKELQQQRYQAFRSTVEDRIERTVMEKIKPHIEKLPFRSESQKQRFLDSVFEELEQTVGRNPVFMERQRALWDAKQGYSDEQAEAIVKTHMTQAESKGLLTTILQRLMADFGLEILQGQAAEKAKEAQAAERREPGGGIPATGAASPTEQQKQSKLAEFMKEDPQSGYQKYLAWCMTGGAS